jgi:hypothetical protein
MYIIHSELSLGETKTTASQYANKKAQGGHEGLELIGRYYLLVYADYS